MMPCPTCKKQIAKTAGACPHCGAKINEGGRLLLIVVAVILIVVIFGMVF